MNSINKKKLGDLGEYKVIQLIEDLIFKKTKKSLIRDDSFYFEILQGVKQKSTDELSLCLNSDMLVATTDVPDQMDYRQIGYKAVIMNISDLIVKGVKPQGIVISFGLPKALSIQDFKSLVKGIIDGCLEFDMDYLGGDVNESKEIIINPTVFGLQERNLIIHRKGIDAGDILVANGKFGLTGVGFDILLNKVKSDAASPNDYKRYKKSINSVLSPKLGLEGLILAKTQLAKASIDSSDGLLKSLQDLMRSNPEVGFEINFKRDLIDEEAIRYSKEFNMPLENLVLYGGGEEFIHLFIMSKKSYKKANEQLKTREAHLIKIGKVISETEIYAIMGERKVNLKGTGYEHFS